jgi:allantoinase
LSADLLVRGGRSLAGAPLEVAITDGRVAEVGEELALDAREVVDADGLTLLPGGLDPHVHFNEPGPRTVWEGWASGSAAAAAGGLTAVVEMPLNAHPPTVDVDAFDLKVAAASGQSWVDFALWGGVVPGNLGELEGLAQRGVVGFKAFMSASGVDDFSASDDLTLYEAMGRIAELGLILAVHAESDNITSALAARARAEGRVSVQDYLDSRPPVAESEAISRAIELAAVTGCRLHIVHVSTARGVELVSAARAAGVDVTCEVTPHNLILTDEDARALGAIAKCAPPLRPRAETERLWPLLDTGEIAFVASDHSPATPDLKPALEGGQDAFATWGGISGVQSLVELMLTEAPRRLGADREAATRPEADTRLGGAIGPAAAERLQATLGPAAAQRLALTHKAHLTPGADGDLALVELGSPRRLTASELRYRNPQSAWAGRELTARVRHTILRGQTVYRDGELVGVPRGRLLTPTKSH